MIFCDYAIAYFITKTVLKIVVCMHIVMRHDLTFVPENIQ